MATSLAALAKLVGGRLLGDGNTAILGAKSLRLAARDDITLVDSREKLARLDTAKVGAVVVPKDLEPSGVPAIQVDDVHLAFAAIVEQFRPPRKAVRQGISDWAIVSPSAKLAEDVDVHAGATVGDDVQVGAGSVIQSGARIMAGCRIAEKVTIFPNAVLYEDTVVGPRSIIHGGAIIGAYGFGYKQANGRHVLSAQLGNVEIGADVEIGAGTTIDRGTYSPTVIGEGTKIDNLVMIAHNCQIGRHNLICSQVGIAGSTVTGDYVVMAGQVGVRDHVNIGAGAVLGAKSGVSNDIPAGAHVLGSPALPEREQKVQFANLSKLSEMRRQLRDLQRTVELLRQKSGIQEDSAAA